jgi:hypothetical protein
MRVSSTYRATALLATALMAGALGVSTSTGANANLISDGDFDIAPQPDASQQYYINYSTPLPGGYWNVLDNNVDVVGPGSSIYSMSPPIGISCCVVDLVGFGNTGGIYQAFTPAVSGLYRLSFQYANNFYSTSTASAAVEIGTTPGGNTILSDGVTHSNSSAANMLWDLYTFTIYLTGSTPLYLGFDTTSGANSGGVVITDVAVNATPIPATWSLMLFGLVGLGFFAYRGTRGGSSAAAVA